MTNPIFRGGALALLLALAGGLSAQEPPALSLSCQGPIVEGGRLVLRFRGEHRLPDRTLLMGSLVRQVEYWEVDKLKIRVADAGGFKARVKNGRFDGSSTVPAPGRYACKVELLDDNQNDAVRPLTLNLAPKTWTFAFNAFDDATIRDLEPGLEAIDALAVRVLGVLKAFETATATPEAWTAAKPDLEPRLAELKKVLEKSFDRALYPAALTELHSTIEVAHQNLPYLAFKDGKFDGAADYHAGGQKVKTHRGDLYGHEAFRRAVEEAPAIAGRELCLWILKDFRRSGRSMRAETAELLQRLSTRAGVAEFAGRLAALTAEEADGLEKDVRTAKLEKRP